MSKCQAGTQCKREGKVGTVQFATWVKIEGIKRTLHGASVRIVTNRFSGLEVELTANHGPFRAGERFQIANEDFVS